MPKFNLRFRRKKLFVGIGLALALLVTPLLQQAFAAGAVLDVAYTSRLQAGPGAPTGFQDQTNVQQGNIAQFGILVHNTEDAFSGETARNFRVRVTIPKNPSTSATSTVQVLADNAVPMSPYTSSDTTTLRSANGQPFTITDIRSVGVERNNVAPTNNPTFNWGAIEQIPNGQIQTSQTADSFVMEIRPNADGNLGPCFQNALRLTFIANIKQAPHLTINKQVRKLGEANWQEGNTAARGETLQYQIKVANTGPARATNVRIRDSLPPRVRLVTGSCQMLVGNQPVQPCVDNFADGGLIFTFIEPGATIFIKINAVIGTDIATTVNEFSNSAGVTSNETPEAFDVVVTTLQRVVTQQGKILIIKFEDKNGNGVQDAGEQGMAGVNFTVTVSGSSQSDDRQVSAQVSPSPTPSATPTATPSATPQPGGSQTVTTGADGTVLVDNLNAGNYNVAEQVPSGFNPTTPTNQQVVVVSGQTTEVKFGNQRIVTPTPTPTPTFTPPVIPPTPTKPLPPTLQLPTELPKTGSAEMVALSVIGLLGGAYYAIRRRDQVMTALRSLTGR